jgi:hypothetical protein
MDVLQYCKHQYAYRHNKADRNISTVMQTQQSRYAYRDVKANKSQATPLPSNSNAATVPRTEGDERRNQPVLLDL